MKVEHYSGRTSWGHAPHVTTGSKAGFLAQLRTQLATAEGLGCVEPLPQACQGQMCLVF